MIKYGIWSVCNYYNVCVFIMNNGVYFIYIFKCEKSIIISEFLKEGSWKVIKNFDMKVL